jgi:ubiquinol-cytochrome c reductase cytochrome b subunit
LPTNLNISYFWNFGSFLGIILIFQILRGLFLRLLFTPRVISFWDLINLTEEINYILFLRWIHLNGASIFFLLVFIHMGRGLFYFSIKKKLIWISGSRIYILIIAAAFIGYILPWGQISLWGGTVITNLFRIINFNLVIWIWGNFSVRQPTLNLFFSLHFLIPFIILILVFIHILLLHETGSSSKIFVSKLKTKFVDYFILKDSINLIFYLLILIFIIIRPWLLGDPENFIEANMLSSPIHIKPEWYFLWAYAILRAIPSKRGGVLALFSAVLIIYFIIFKRNNNNKNKNILLIFLLIIFLFLTYLGGCPVEIPFIFLSQIFRFLYFLILILLFVI